MANDMVSLPLSSNTKMHASIVQCPGDKKNLSLMKTGWDISYWMCYLLHAMKSISWTFLRFFIKDIFLQAHWQPYGMFISEY